MRKQGHFPMVIFRNWEMPEIKRWFLIAHKFCSMWNFFLRCIYTKTEWMRKEFYFWLFHLLQSDITFTFTSFWCKLTFHKNYVQKENFLSRIHCSLCEENGNVEGRCVSNFLCTCFIPIIKHLITYPPFLCFVVIGHDASNQKLLFITCFYGNDMATIRQASA